VTRRDALPATALAAQIVLQVMWHGVFDPSARWPVAVVLALALAPMIMLIPAAMHSFRRMLLVGGILSLLYFSHGVMELIANPPARVFAAIEIALACAAIFGFRKTPKPA
jgi:uncharacterized membrane protein